MRKYKLTLKIFILILVIDILESIGELVMKSGLNQAGIFYVTINNLPEVILRGASSYLIWAGVILYTINFLILIAVLSRVQLSVASPLGSTCYIYVPILAVIFLHERVTPLRWVGIALIILGIHLVSQSTQLQEE